LHTVAFFAQGSHAVYALQQLFATGIKVENIAVITTDDKNNDVFKYFLDFNGMDFYIYDGVKNTKAYIINKLSSVDLIISIANRVIIKNELVDLCNYGAVNLHPGKLPEYKGSFCIPWALINSDTHVGYAYHYITSEVDAGNILFSNEFIIDNEDNAHNLHYKVMTDAITNLSFVIEKIIKKEQGILQKKEGNYYKNQLPFEGRIDPTWNMEQVNQFLKAMYFPPYTGAVVELNGKEYIVNNLDEYIDLINKG